ncbi:MAG: hypothetical protein M1816_006504 [Peltula sp. TS41687]|nr:MAG: hypothetical protein M1816_006504 [Peltula sp. TS41687]
MDVIRDVLSHPSPLDPAEPKNIRPYISYGPYAPSVSSSVSSSSVVSPVFSIDGASSQSSVASSTCSSSLDVVWESDVSSVLSSCRDAHSSTDHNPIETPSTSGDGAAATTRSRSGSSASCDQTGSVAIPPDQRRNRRRSNRDVCASAPCARPPPSLVRQSERRLNFVDGLVGKLVSPAKPGTGSLCECLLSFVLCRCAKIPPLRSSKSFGPCRMWPAEMSARWVVAECFR